ncbi:DNA-packaging protein [Pseudomonas reactans]|nr:DNA-packaging protein [Pseudomonas reactans]
MTWITDLRAWLPLVLIGALGFWVNHLQDAAHDDGYAEAQAAGDLALGKLKSEHQDAELARTKADADRAKADAKKLQDEQARNDKLASDLVNQQRKHRQTTDRLSGEIARVNDLYRKALDAEPEPVPACVFTAGWVRVYNEATGASTARLPAPAVSGGTAAPSAEARAADQLDSGVSPSGLLAHHVRYAEQCRNTSDQLDALIDAVQGNH